MDSYLLKCETTGSEALLVSISVTSNLFSLITPHEKTETAIEDILIVDLNNFRLKQALYCAASDLFLNKKRVEKDLEKKKSLSSEEYGDQSIYLMKKGASLYVPEKAILLDGHHRYSVINKYFFEDNNYVPIVFIDYKSLVVRDHYFSLDKIDMKEEVEDYLLHRCIPTNDNNYYDLQFFDGSKSHYFILKDSKDTKTRNLRFFLRKDTNDTKTRNRRFFLRDEVIKEYGFKPSPPLQKDKAGTQIYIAAKSPSKEELLSGELFPSKSTWITPKFNPELYKEYLNIERLN